MLLNTAHVRQLLRDFDFGALFIDELGWDTHQSTREVWAGGQDWTLEALAHKRGMVAYHCPALAQGRLPEYPVRRRIEREVAKAAHEHLIIFTDAAHSTQVWQWVRREPGKPAACREHVYRRQQPGDALIQKLQSIAFSLEEEETLTLPDVTGRARAGFDLERVTRRFYDRFKKEHAAFLGFISGITEQGDREWYASVMLNRLMFIYFIQRKGFLDGDANYLRNRLTRMQAEHGRDRFYSFYQFFLRRLFHEGLGGRERTAELERLLGHIPYLDGGLFELHAIEQRYAEIQIPDAAFKRVFDYFDQYQWHLDERPLRADNEINPDVLGYIFEKYINQKQMGAYYTKEDITEYISKNTVIPFLLDAARRECRVGFENPGGPTVWDLLAADPDRYIYSTVKHGASRPLPDEIAAGIDPPTLHRPVGEGPVQTLELRKGWNQAAPAEYALPTETWREVVARRQRYEDAWYKLAAGEVREVDDLITLNLDVRQFAQDVIESCEGPDLLRALWHSIETVTILDPTCGSGAFLFAALNILEPLYDACLERMEAFVTDLERSGEKHRPEKLSDFRRVLERVDEHPNRRCFVLKSIILQNLYGVDIMDEAVEICKLRLFLKLAAQVEPDAARENLGIEPLPDIDFNIRAGNTLVGYATEKQVRQSFNVAPGGQGRMLLGDDAVAYARFEERVHYADQAFRRFRAMQTQSGMQAEDFVDAKQTLRQGLNELEEELNRRLVSECGVERPRDETFEGWRRSHRPFHWFVEFYNIVDNGGFDVVIGNPPYVEISNMAGQYTIRNLQLTGTGNLFSVCVERFSHLLRNRGRIGVIVPISSISTPRMMPLMELLVRVFSPAHLSNYAVRPGKLFVGADMNLTILIGRKASSSTSVRLFSTEYLRWGEQTRSTLFERLSYTDTVLSERSCAVGKIGNALALRILKRLEKHPTLARYRSTTKGSDRVYYHSGGRYFRKCIRDQLSNEYKELSLRCGVGDVAILLLSSSFYYWFWIAFSDCYHVTKRDVDALPVPDSILTDASIPELASRLLRDLWKHAESRTRNRADGSQREETNFHVGESKALIDENDQVIAQHYGFTEEELDFIINFDIRYRGGHDGGVERE